MQVDYISGMDAKLEIPGFELIEKIGQGGMASVWKARQISLDRVVAIKLLNPQTACLADDQERLMAEAHSAAQLKHPGIVQVHDAGITDGISYFVMEYVAGYSVGQWLRRKHTLPPEDALVVIECVAQSLNYAWKTAGIIHCDVKPDNIMVDQDGTIKVADLGLARSIGAVKADPGNKNEIMGTPGYISPEQSGGRTDLDCRADIYSLGATLYHLTTGKRLFEKHGDTEAMDLQVTGHEKDPLLLQPSLPLGVAWLIEKMLVKDRRHRYPEWESVLLDIEKVKTGELPQRPFPCAGTSTITRSDARVRLTRAWEHQQQIRQRRHALARGIPFAAGILGLAVLTALLWSDTQRRRHSSRPPAVTTAIDAPPPRSSVASDQTETPTIESETAEDLYHFVIRWIEEHPSQYDEAIRRLSRVVEDTRGTRYSLMAEDMLATIRNARQDALDAAWQSLSETIESMSAAGRFRAAAVYALEYDGPWREDLMPRLRRRTEELTQRAEAHEATQAQAARESERRTAALLDELADICLEQSVPEALQHLEKSLADQGQTLRREQLDPLTKVLWAASNLDREVLDSFTAQIGREITIEFIQGPRTFFVRGVRDNRLRLEQRLEGSARVEFEFSVQDLATSEYLARLGSPDRHEVALMSGWHAFRGRKFEDAEERFKKTHPLLADRLADRSRQAQRLQLEEAARQGFHRLTMDLGIEADPSDHAAILSAVQALDLTKSVATLRDGMERFRAEHNETEFLQKIDPLLDELTAMANAIPGQENHQPAVTATVSPIDHRALADAIDLLQTRNPGLLAHQINLLRDHNHQVYGLAIRSDALRDISPLSTLRNLRKLETFGGAIRDLSPLATLRHLDELDIEGLASRDFQHLARLRLRRLGLPGSAFSDVNILRHMPLTELNLNRTAVRDLSGLRGMRLQTLEIEETRVFALHGLGGMPLEKINLAGTGVKDIGTLQGMPLRELNLARTGVHDFSPLRSLPLRSLNVAETQFRDTQILQGLPLTDLDLSGTRVADLAPLRNSTLRHLALRNTSVRDLSPLQGSGIRTLFLDHCRGIRTLNFTAGMPLRELGISDSGIDDLSTLQAPELHALYMENTPIRDITPLQGLPIRVLSLRGSPINDYTPLASMPIESLTISRRSESAYHVLWRIRTLRSVNGNPWPPERI